MVREQGLAVVRVCDENVVGGVQRVVQEQRGAIVALRQLVGRPLDLCERPFQYR